MEGSAQFRLQDSRQSWFALALCTLVLHTSTLGSRSHGAMYVGMRQHFNVSHSEASFPPSLQASLSLTGGILSGYLCEVLPLRWVSLGSTLIASLALTLCYFSPNVAIISLLFGVFNGLGISVTFVATSVVLCEYFVRWRATACAFSSAAKSSHFLTPFVANYILVEYGSPAVFLLLGALSFNGFAATLLIDTPPWLERKKVAASATSAPGHTESQPLGFVSAKTTGVPAAECDDAIACEGAHVTDFLLSALPEDNKTGGCSDAAHVFAPSAEKAIHLGASGRCLDIKLKDTGLKDIDLSDCVAEKDVQLTINSNHSNTLTCYYKVSAFLRRAVRSLVAVNWRVFVTPVFLLDSLSFSLQNFVLSNFVLFHLDVTLNAGLDTGYASYLLLTFSVSIVLGCLVIGIVIDRHWLSLETTIVLSFLGNAAACQGLVWSVSGGQLLVCAVVQGLSCGVMAPLSCPVLIKDFSGESLPLVMGGCHTLMGIALLTRPPLVGYFKDAQGSYSGIQHIFTSLNGLLAIIWLTRVLRSLRSNK